MPPLNIIFMGSAELSCPSLDALLNSTEFKVSAVVTQPDRPKGRHLKPTPSPVKELAVRCNLPVLQPEKAREEGFVRQLADLTPDLIVVVAYGQILPRPILELPKFGCINVHTSLLPKYRGAAPIQWAVLNGEPETGVTIMKMDAGLDTGDILTQEATAIEPSDTSATLHDRLAQIGAGLLVRTIQDFVAGKVTPKPQDGSKSSYAAKIRKQDGEIDWTKPAVTIWNQVRGLTPWPGAYTWFTEAGPSLRLKILKCEPVSMQGTAGTVLDSEKNTIVIGCGEQALKVLGLQLEGGRALTPQQFLAGHPLAPGYRFSGTSPNLSSQ